MKKCTKCKIEKDESCFSIRNNKSGKLQSWCKECIKIYDKLNSSLQSYKKRKYFNRSNIAKRNRQKLLEYLSASKCVDCGESDPVVLEFDHINKNKEYNISCMIYSYSWELIKIEINKCVVRCANCHRRKTAKELGWYKHLTKK